MKRAVKRVAQSIALAIAFPGAALCAFGRAGALFAFFAQAFAAIPGLPGSYLRVGFYRLTLRHCSPDVTISFGTVFSSSRAAVHDLVSLGLYCVVGAAEIGARCQIASLVNIPSGRHDHKRDESGRLVDSGESAGLTIGADCWIGSSAVVMASVGPGSVIGAGAIVVKDIPANSVAVGNPAKVIRPAQ